MAGMLQTATRALSGLFSGRKAAPGQTFYPVGFEALITNALSGDVNLNPHQAFRIYEQSAAVASAVNLIASKIEQIRPVIRKEDGTIDDESEVLDFLSKPNIHQPWRRWIGQFSRHWLLAGNAYVLNLGTVTQPPRSMFNPHPSEVNPMIDGMDTFPGKYSVSSNLGLGTYQREELPRFGLRYYSGPLREVAHLRDFTTRTQNLLGNSPLEPILLDIKSHIQGKIHNQSMLSKGGRIGAIFNFKDKMSEPQFKERQKNIQDTFGGSKNAGAIGVFASSDLEYTALGMNNVDMDYVELTKITLDSISRHFKIPGPLFNSDVQTFNNYEAAILALYDDAVLPTLDQILEFLTHLLFPRFGLDPRREALAYNENDITALRKRMNEELKLRKETGLETPNELREMIPGRDDVEGGDKIQQPATLVPLGEDPLNNPDTTAEDEAARIADNAPGDS